MYYQGEEIKTLYYQGRQITLLYYRGNVLYELKEGETYAITQDISTFTGVFDWVYNKKDSKWYRYNNLGTYEPYGVYGTTINPNPELQYGVQITSGYYLTQVTQNTKMRIEADFTTPEVFNGNSCFITGVRNATSSSSTNQTYCIAFASKALRMDAGNTSNTNLYTVTENTRYKVIYDLDGTTLNWSISGRDGKVLASGTKTITSPASSDLNVFTVGALNRLSGPVVSTQQFTYWGIKYYKDDILVADYKFDENQNMYDVLSGYSVAAAAGTIVTKEDIVEGATTYKGKLSIVNGTEYKYDGSWNEIGAVVEGIYPEYYEVVDAPTLIINFATQAEFESYQGDTMEGLLAYVEETSTYYIWHDNSWEIEPCVPIKCIEVSGGGTYTVPTGETEITDCKYDLTGFKTITQRPGDAKFFGGVEPFFSTQNISVSGGTLEEVDITIPEGMVTLTYAFCGNSFGNSKHIRINGGSNLNYINASFHNLPNLESLYVDSFENATKKFVHLPGGNDVKLTDVYIGKLPPISFQLDAPNLTYESLHSLIYALPPSGNTTWTMGSGNLAKLTEQDIAWATMYHWTLQ